MSKACKKKKKDNYNRERKKKIKKTEGSNSTTRLNIVKALDKKCNRLDQDVSQMTYWNYDKKGHYSIKYLQSSKPKN